MAFDKTLNTFFKNVRQEYVRTPPEQREEFLEKLRGAFEQKASEIKSAVAAEDKQILSDIENRGQQGSHPGQGRGPNMGDGPR